MTIRHIVLFRFADDATEEQIGSMSSGLSGLQQAIAEIQAYRHGRDAGISNTSWDYAVIADFDSPQAFQAYRDHPRHQEVLRERIQPIVAERASVQLTVG